MRVLDVGSGVGDIAILVARLVGPDGSVVGVDVDGSTLQTARDRAGLLGLQNVTFIQGDVRSAEIGADFDAAVGRLVLLYLADPAEALHAIKEHVRPGGVLAFQELDLDQVPSRSFPEGTLWDETGRLVIETFAGAGTHVRMGRQLFSSSSKPACLRLECARRRSWVGSRFRRLCMAGRRGPRSRPVDGQARDRTLPAARPGHARRAHS